jgi:hypothetical protein
MQNFEEVVRKPFCGATFFGWNAYYSYGAAHPAPPPGRPGVSGGECGSLPGRQARWNPAVASVRSGEILPDVPAGSVAVSVLNERKIQATHHEGGQTTTRRQRLRERGVN